MKKTLLTVLAVLLVAGGGSYLFKGQLWEFAKEKITADMFIAADTDNFDPGLAIGASFPTIRAVYQGREITGVRQFVHDKGMIFIANRSADW
jgi:hypothetical protein